MDRKAERFLEHLDPLQGPLEGYCRRALLSADAAEDVLQAAVTSAYRDFQRYAEGTNFRAWIFGYVYHEIQNANRRWRREQHEKLPADLRDKDESGGPEPVLPLQQSLLEDPDLVIEQCDAVLAEELRELKPQERDVLLLLAVGDFKYAEIAAILRIPIGTVMSSLARCRARLRDRLERYGRDRGLLKDEQSD